jgi:Fe-S-cluster containining protein
MKDSSATRVHKAFDRALEPVLAEAAAHGERPPCRAGCAWCCYEPVYADQREAELIAERVSRMPAADQERIREATRAWVATFIASPLVGVPDPHVLDYRRLRLACPLLKDGQCSVYEDRPLGCRAHIAQRTAELCAADSLRLRQQFLVTAPLVLRAMAEWLPRGIETDHLAMILHRQFFGEGRRSGAYAEWRGKPETAPGVSPRPTDKA